MGWLKQIRNLFTTKDESVSQSDPGENTQSRFSGDSKSKKQSTLIPADYTGLCCWKSPYPAETEQMRIYVTGHPRKTGLYFEGVCTDVLRNLKGSIWYDPQDFQESGYVPEPANMNYVSAEGGETDRMKQLGSMQLCIFLVTADFLHKDCRARQTDYVFAMEHHIPVLPILMEPDMNEEFVQEMNSFRAGYGDVTALNKLAADYAEIPFCDRLSNILHSILMSDELDSQIRNIMAEDSGNSDTEPTDSGELPQDPERTYRIGLAYINGIEVERDVEKAIRMLILAANEGCSAAAEKLADMYFLGRDVERNYEVSLNWTDKCVSIRKKNYEKNHDAESLVNALKTQADRLLEHGLSVQADDSYCQALQYLEEADFTGRPEEKDRYWVSITERRARIADMKGDTRQAIEAYRKLLDRLENLYEAEPGMWETMYTDIGSRLGYEYWQDGKLNEAEILLNRAVKLHKLSADRTGDPERLRKLCGDYVYMANLAMTRDKSQEAEKYFQKALELIGQTGGESASYQDLYSEYVCMTNLGNFRLWDSKLDQAEDYFSKSLDCIIHMQEIRKSFETDRALSAVLTSLGDVAIKKKDFSTAMDRYTDCLEIRKALAEETENAQAKRDLAVIYSDISRLYKRSGDIKSAGKNNMDSLTILTDLFDQNHSFDNGRMLSNGWYYQGEINEAYDHPDMAEECYKIALSYALQTEGITDSLVGLECITRPSFQLAILCKEKDPATAVELFKKAGSAFYQKLEIRKDTEDTVNLAVCSYNLGQLLEKDHPGEARQHYDLAYDFYGSGFEKLHDPELYKMQVWCAYHLGELGDRDMEARAYEMLEVVKKNGW